MTLDLVNYTKSDISYKLSEFPDGQQQVTICNNGHIGTSWNCLKVQLKATLNNFQDLELIICATKSLRILGVKDITLYVPYFLGCRSDRVFTEGENHYLRDVICPIINSLNFTNVLVLDPHSDVLEALIPNLIKTDNSELVKWAINDIYKSLGDTAYLKQKDFALVSPDAGAAKKIYKLASNIQFYGDVLVCSKDRNKDGVLTDTTVNWSADLDRYKGKDFIIIDDICDGGRTFINIAEVLKSYFPDNKIYLIITHGIFSKGYSELSEYFDGIYCTNSYKDLNAGKGCKFKQLNVF